MSYPSHSSGDLLADRRFAYAEQILSEGDAAGAADLLRQTLERTPHWVPAWMALGSAEERGGNVAAAAEAYRTAADLDPSGLFGARLHLACIAEEDASGIMPSAYVRALFDDYAARFDQHLVVGLSYRGPALLTKALTGRCGERRFVAALDLGCGTGLMGAAVRDRVDSMDGVDLSPLMLDKARLAGLYRTLTNDEITRHLAGLAAHAYDLVLAADVLVYIGALGVVLNEVAAQESHGEAFRLGSELRFSHSAGYVRDTIAQAGLDLLTLSGASTRRERGEDVPGLVVVARKPYA